MAKAKAQSHTGRQTRAKDEVAQVRAQFKKELRLTQAEMRRRLKHRPKPRGDEPQVVITV